MAGLASEHSRLHDDWARFITRNLCTFAFRTRRERDFQVKAQVRFRSGFLVARFSTIAGNAQLERRGSDIQRDGKEAYALYIPLQAEHEVAQFGRSARCGPGSMVMVSMAEPFLHTKYGDNDTEYLFLPREFVDQRATRMEESCARSVPASTGLQRLTSESLRMFQRTACEMSPEQFLSAARVMGELATIAMSGHEGLMCDVRSVRVANLARVKRAIRARFSDPELRLADIAAECGLSLRYMHSLFRDELYSVAEYLLKVRLQRAQYLLQNADLATTTVTNVAMACGFSNPSHFSTAFRRAFSISPKDVLHRR